MRHLTMHRKAIVDTCLYGNNAKQLTGGLQLISSATFFSQGYLIVHKMWNKSGENGAIKLHELRFYTLIKYQMKKEEKTQTDSKDEFETTHLPLMYPIVVKFEDSENYDLQKQSFSCLELQDICYWFLPTVTTAQTSNNKSQGSSEARKIFSIRLQCFSDKKPITWSYECDLLDTCNVELINQIRSSAGFSPAQSYQIISNTIVELGSDFIQLYYIQKVVTEDQKLISLVSLKYVMSGIVPYKNQTYIDAELYLNSGVLHKEYIFNSPEPNLKGSNDYIQYWNCENFFIGIRSGFPALLMLQNRCSMSSIFKKFIMAVDLEQMVVVPDYFMRYWEVSISQGNFCILGNQMLMIKRMKADGSNIFIVSYPTKTLRASKSRMVLNFPTIPESHVFLNEWCFSSLNSLVVLIERVPEVSDRLQVDQMRRFYLAVFKSEKLFDQRLKWTIDLDELV